VGDTPLSETRRPRELGVHGPFTFVKNTHSRDGALDRAAPEPREHSTRVEGVDRPRASHHKVAQLLKTGALHQLPTIVEVGKNNRGGRTPSE
jgi:hypothetical protein